MNAPRCASPIPLEALLDYWLGDGPPAHEVAIEEHLFSCEQCSGLLGWLIDVAHGTRDLAREGLLRVMVGEAFLDHLGDGGLVLRQYRVAPGGSVACTVTPHDDVMVARLVAPFDPPDRADLVVCDAQGEERMRLPDIAIDPARGEVVFTEPIDALRALGVSTTRMRLVAVEKDGERLLGEYTFHHTPHSGERDA